MAKLPRSLHGRVVVVTGGGRGIGRAIAARAGRQGLPRGDRRPRRAAAREAAEALGGEAVGLALDVTDPPGFTTFLDEVERRLGPIDVLVNNAGIMAVGPFDEEDDATVVRQLEINLHAVIHGTKEAVRRMKPRGTGHIVNVASSAGKTGFPNLATYCATKHGVVGLSEAVRFELRGTGVEISVVMPGIVQHGARRRASSSRAASRSPRRRRSPTLVVEALEFPRFDVFVPKSIGPTWAALQVLPRRAREAIARALKVDRALRRRRPRRPRRLRGARRGERARAPSASARPV